MGILKNFRRGFATNSSSSHSFVYMKKPQPQDGAVPTGDDFGWNDFRLNTVKEKLFYVLTDRLSRRGWDPDRKDTGESLKAQYGRDFPEFEESDFIAASESYVDHQSLGTISLEQARDPYVVVFGGNDNDGASQLRHEAEDEIDWAATEISDVEYEYGSVERVKEKKKAALREAVALPVSTGTSKKFHIGKDGAIKPCRASKRPCPYSSDDHFVSKEEAEQELERRHS